MGTLADLLVATLSAARDGDPPARATGSPDDLAGEALEQRLAGLWQAGRAAWPTVDIPAETFVRHLAERLPVKDALADGLAAVHADDLYLACGCTQGDPAAIAAFEARYMTDIAGQLQRRPAFRDFADELAQTLRERWLVGDKSHAPRIAQYNGRGALGGWLNMAATWAAIDQQRAQRSDAPLAERDIASATADPEFQFIRSRYAADLRDAFAATLAAMDSHDAAVLRLFFLEGMSTEMIGRAYRVTSRAVRQWIASARRKILEETLGRLRSRLRLPAGEEKSLLRMLDQDLDTSIVKVLRND